MRKALSILLLLAMVLPVMLPAAMLAQSPEQQLPVCCRRNGAHHCAMQNPLQQMAKAPAWRKARERCPYEQGVVSGMHLDSTAIAVSHAAVMLRYARVLGVAQVESLRRVAKERARGKRGPPVVALL